MHAPRGCVVVEAEEVAAHAAAVRLRDGEHGVDGNGGIDHGPARSQHVHARQGGERMGGGDEAAASERNRTPRVTDLDRKSTRLNSSHLVISYAVFCLKKKKKKRQKYCRAT